MMSTEEPETFIVIPEKSLSKEAFQNLVEEFILREGTDYGHDEVTLDDKKHRVFQQLQAREVKIVFSTKTENCTLMRSSDL